MNTTATPHVRVVRLPDEMIRLGQYRANGEPRLVYLEGNVAPPQTLDPLEDWVRPPINNDDLAARLERLRALYLSQMKPALSEDGVLEWRGRRQHLPPIEAMIVRCLLDAGGEAVSRQEFEVQIWPGQPTTRRNALDVHVSRLRRRLAPMSIAIRALWGRGYILEVGRPDPVDRAAPPAAAGRGGTGATATRRRGAGASMPVNAMV